MSQYIYTIDNGETWSTTLYGTVDTSKAAAIEEYRRKGDNNSSLRVHIGIVVHPVEILERESAQWMAALRCALQDILEENMPWVEDYGPFFEVQTQHELKKYIMEFLETANIQGFCVDNVQEHIIEETS